MRRPAAFALALALWAGVATATPSAGAMAQTVVLGSGRAGGPLHHVGRAICRVVNAETSSHGVTCELRATAGSIFNLTNVRAGRLALGVTRSDWQYYAVQGTTAFEHVGPDEDLRALFAVHSAPVTVLARGDAGIRQLDELRGKRVNIADPGSDLRATLNIVMAAKGWDKQSFALANELPAGQQALALCHDRIQAMVLVVEHPDSAVERILRQCHAVIVEVDDPAIDQLVRDRPFYTLTEVPGGLYGGHPDPVATFGVSTTVVASAALDGDAVYAVVSSLFENLGQFKQLYPAFGTLAPERMVRDGLSAPLHEGARRYYEEKGLM